MTIVAAAEILPDCGVTMGAFACRRKIDAPSVKEAFDAFEGLPEGHPLKTQFESKQVRVGYEALGTYGFDPATHNYYQLAASLPL